MHIVKRIGTQVAFGFIGFAVAIDLKHLRVAEIGIRIGESGER